jgi:glycogen debranching enzyme
MVRALWNIPRNAVRQHGRVLLLLFFLFICCCGGVGAEDNRDAAKALDWLRWSTDSTGPRRFVSVHGRRAAIFGYPQSNGSSYLLNGLEIWTYPVQILTSYHVAFRTEGTTTAIEGQQILRRIVYSPEAVTRIYAGPDFIVREKLFVPLDEPGAIITYDVEGTRSIDIEIRFVPVLDVMWPASIGGQATTWDPKASGYLLRESSHRFIASIGSPEIVAHDDTPNIGQRVGEAPGLAFTIRAGGDHRGARVIIAEGSNGQEVNETAKTLLNNASALEASALKHYGELLSHSLRIETPDAEVNRALSWAEIALDQAWVCNPDLGCGLVAGYGPSRNARRPQYDWFFAGDGMVTIEGLLATGQYERAREELEFIPKYQDRNNGMIWHELSQSAGLIDWNKYPYMFGHVNLTFQFLETAGSYFEQTGDLRFVKEHWVEIQSAFDYCSGLIDSKDGLPRIPRDKQGDWEQDPLTDELTLSVSWARGAQAYANLASAVGRSELAGPAALASQLALQSIGERYWDKEKHLWIMGYTRSGKRLVGRGIGPSEISEKQLISDEELRDLLNQLAAPDFQTDWGTRSNPLSAADYDPNSYSRGSVWATGTARMANDFWSQHRPVTAWPTWEGLVPWSSLDSLGHMHEVLAGDFYHEEVESVPEQTWSSATFLSSAVSGLLGIEIDASLNRLILRPHLPANWKVVSLSGIRIGTSQIDVKMTQSSSDIRLELENSGDPVEAVFDPEVPQGARLGKAYLGHQVVAAQLEAHPQDNHARVQFRASHGSSLLTISYRGGVSVIPDSPQVQIGGTSKAIKFIDSRFAKNVYTVDFDYVPSVESGFDLRSTWAIQGVGGASERRLSPDLYRVTIIPDLTGANGQYKHGRIAIAFETGDLKGK